MFDLHNDGETVEEVALTAEEIAALQANPVRRLIPKSTVTARLIDAGLMDEADAVLNSNKAYLYRWFTPDWPNVYADDEGLLAVLTAIGADIEAITAP